MKKWKIISEEDVSPSPWYKIYKQKVQLPDGKVIDDFYVSKLGDVSTIIAIDDDKKILMAKQYKHGLGKVTLELPAGRIKKGDTKLSAAKRELMEETGYKADNYIEIGGVCPVPTKDGSIMYGFIATGLEDTGCPNPDITENIEVEKYTLDQIKQMIKEGEIVGSDAIALLTIAELKQPELF